MIGYSTTSPSFGITSRQGDVQRLTLRVGTEPGERIYFQNPAPNEHLPLLRLSVPFQGLRPVMRTDVYLSTLITLVDPQGEELITSWPLSRIGQSNLNTDPRALPLFDRLRVSWQRSYVRTFAGIIVPVEVYINIDYAGHAG